MHKESAAGLCVLMPDEAHMLTAQRIDVCVIQGRDPTWKLTRSQAAAESPPGPCGIITKLYPWRRGSSAHAAAAACSGRPGWEACTQACSRRIQHLIPTRRRTAALNLY